VPGTVRVQWTSISTRRSLRLPVPDTSTSQYPSPTASKKKFISASAPGGILTLPVGFASPDDGGTSCPLSFENRNVYAERFMTKVDRAADEVVAVQARRDESGAVFGRGDRSLAAINPAPASSTQTYFIVSPRYLRRCKYRLLPSADHHRSHRQIERASRSARRLCGKVDFSFRFA
jgi:hypothetical protein